ncbi:sporulation protein [Bacillus bombysepticus]|uniref:sporulation protein n=1 Tax=Bacillus bombysepticus TaxID=658666 RepID=UPI0030164406
MFKKILAKMGKGAATVDLRFENKPYCVGETVSGEVVIVGGEVEQNINKLSVNLMMKYSHDEESIKRVIAQIPLSSGFIIRPKEDKRIPFTYLIPADIPISTHSVTFYLDTQLDIQGGVDRGDIDYLKVEKSQIMLAVFNALSIMGFREKHSSGKLTKNGQEFSFFPTVEFSGKIEEIELIFSNEITGVRIWMEVDNRNGHEVKREFFVGNEVIHDITRLIGLLQNEIDKGLVADPYNTHHSYTSNNHQYVDHHNNHGVQSGGKGSMAAGVVGGLVAGAVGGYVLNEALEDVNPGEVFESAMENIEETVEEFEETVGNFFGSDDE